ncbi:hypothetical protein VPNG_05424 [Cytospora leucostoma]|uniref:CsbD-like domain-containing protein n=1 Tax=Cytospora leucostoma TaxID=1230097 RepID=A0A423XBS1_9PEZI|nr:hypothetical protein VPNG_05424 [Cytospora leucostoma]
MSSNENNTSTFQAAVDNVTGAVQSAIGSITGSTGDKAEGQTKQDKAHAEHDASQAAVKVPGGTVTASGVAKDDPDRAAGSWNQTAGSAKETVGNVFGVESLKKSGREQNLEGQQQEAKGQLSDLGSGVADRVTGTLGGAVAGVTGNKAAEADYQKQHDTGKTQQRGAEHDIQKQAEA